MTAYTIMKTVIESKKKTKERCLEMLDVYLAADRLTDEEYAELVALVETTYAE